MNKIFYFIRGKEELDIAVELFNVLNNNNFSNFVDHMLKSMDFLVDFINMKHVDLVENINEQNDRLALVFGPNFVEDYFYIFNMRNKKAKVLGDKIIMYGKKEFKMTKNDFRNLLERIVHYFNRVYEQVVDDYE